MLSSGCFCTNALTQSQWRELIEAEYAVSKLSYGGAPCRKAWTGCVTGVSLLQRKGAIDLVSLQARRCA